MKFLLSACNRAIVDIALLKELETMTRDEEASKFSFLIDKAEASLTRHLIETPRSKHAQLRPIFDELRRGEINRERYPTARDLLWDDPITEQEKQCVNDALEIFRYIKR